MFETFFAKTKLNIGNLLYFFLKDHFDAIVTEVAFAMTQKQEVISKPLLIKLKEDYYPSKTEGNVIDIQDKFKEKEFKEKVKHFFELPDSPDSAA